MSRRAISFAWSEGYIVLYEDSGDLVIEAYNTRLRLSEREIEVEGLFQGVREHVEGRKGEMKAVYIDFAFPVKGIESPRDVVFRGPVDTYVGRFGVSYTVLRGIGHYLTIYPPGGALYDHAVLSEDFLMLYMLARRQLYLMDEGEVKKIILV